MKTTSINVMGVAGHLASLLPGAIAAATPATTNLGSVTFGSPSCGAFDKTVVATDCDNAATELFAAHCTGGVCSIPASPQAQISAIQGSSGSCQVIVGAFVNGGAATFNQGPVQSAFPGFVSFCDQASQNESGNRGSSQLDSTNGKIRLVFLSSYPQSSG